MVLFYIITSHSLEQNALGSTDFFIRFFTYLIFTTYSLRLDAGSNPGMFSWRTCLAFTLYHKFLFGHFGGHRNIGRAFRNVCL